MSRMAGSAQWHGGGLVSAHIWTSGWWKDDRTTLDGRGLWGWLWESRGGTLWPGVRCEVMGGGRGHDIRPTWPLNTSPWEGDVPAAPLWPPKGWAGWGLWPEDITYVVEVGEGALGGQEPTELWEQVFGSCQPGTPGPGLPPCKSQTWGPEMGLPQAALLLLWPLMLGAESQESREP